MARRLRPCAGRPEPDAHQRRRDRLEPDHGALVVGVAHEGADADPHGRRANDHIPLLRERWFRRLDRTARDVLVLHEAINAGAQLAIHLFLIVRPEALIGVHVIAHESPVEPGPAVSIRGSSGLKNAPDRIAQTRSLTSNRNGRPDRLC